MVGWCSMGTFNDPWISHFQSLSAGSQLHSDTLAGVVGHWGGGNHSEVGGPVTSTAKRRVQRVPNAKFMAFHSHGTPIAGFFFERKILWKYIKIRKWFPIYIHTIYPFYEMVYSSLWFHFSIVQEVREMTQLSAKDETWTEEVTVELCFFFPANPMIFIIFRFFSSFFIMFHHFSYIFHHFFISFIPVFPYIFHALPWGKMYRKDWSNSRKIE